MLNKNDRAILEISIRMALQQYLSESCVQNVQLENFVCKSATYEQLLNVTFNQHYKRYQLSTDLLECIAMRVVCERLQPLLNEKVDLTIYGIAKHALANLRNYGQRHPGVKVFAKWISLGIAASVASAYVYNKILSVYIKGCKGKEAKELIACIKKVKIQSHQKAIQALKTAQTSCTHLEDPEEVEICQREYTYEIERIQKRIARLSG